MGSPNHECIKQILECEFAQDSSSGFKPWNLYWILTEEKTFYGIAGIACELTLQFTGLFHSMWIQKNPVDLIAGIEMATSQIFLQHGKSLDRLVTNRISPVIERNGGVEGNLGDIVDIHELDQTQRGQDKIA